MCLICDGRALSPVAGSGCASGALPGYRLTEPEPDYPSPKSAGPDHRSAEPPRWARKPLAGPRSCRALCATGPRARARRQRFHLGSARSAASPLIARSKPARTPRGRSRCVGDVQGGAPAPLGPSRNPMTCLRVPKTTFWRLRWVRWTDRGTGGATTWSSRAPPRCAFARGRPWSRSQGLRVCACWKSRCGMPGPVRSAVSLACCGSQGVGRALAEKFLDLGDNVVICSRSEATVTKAAEELRRAGRMVPALCGALRYCSDGRHPVRAAPSTGHSA